MCVCEREKVCAFVCLCVRVCTCVCARLCSCACGAGSSCACGSLALRAPPTPPPSSAAPAPPAPRLSCVVDFSAARFGAVGNGVNDDTDTLAAADAALQSLYLPLAPTKTWAAYRVARNLTLTKPLIVPCGSR